MLSLEKLREKADLKQQEVGEKMNVTQSAVSQWESGETHPKTTLLSKLAALYNCTLDELVTAIAVTKTRNPTQSPQN